MKISWWKMITTKQLICIKPHEFSYFGYVMKQLDNIKIRDMTGLVVCFNEIDSIGGSVEPTIAKQLRLDKLFGVCVFVWRCDILRLSWSV